jgi:predicted RNase H-like HicB family nuclease
MKEMPEELRLTITYEPADEGGFVARIREVPGAISEGETKEEARENVLDALRELALSYLEDDVPGDPDGETIAVRVG